MLQVAMVYREVQVIHPQWPRVEDTEEIMELMEEVVVEEDTMHRLVRVDMGKYMVRKLGNESNLPCILLNSTIQYSSNENYQ